MTCPERGRGDGMKTEEDKQFLYHVHLQYVVTQTTPPPCGDPTPLPRPTTQTSLQLPVHVVPQSQPISTFSICVSPSPVENGLATQDYGMHTYCVCVHWSTSLENPNMNLVTQHGLRVSVLVLRSRLGYVYNRNLGPPHVCHLSGYTPAKEPTR